jgi:hypothetical protein
MTEVTLEPLKTTADVHATAAAAEGDRDPLFTDMCGTLFSSLARSDQRRKGAQYLRGLLDVNGRKSIRNIATRLGGPAFEQSLHHFVVSSTWDWRPMREALARYVITTTAPFAWVVKPTIIPKVGDHSIGVGRRFVPNLGRVINAQLAVGVWAVSEQLSCPVNWRLHLSPSDLYDGHRQRQDAERSESLSDSAIAAFLEVVEEWLLDTRPVIMDVRHWDVAATLSRLQYIGHPFLVRVPGSTALALADTILPGHGGTQLTAVNIMTAFKDRRRMMAGGRGKTRHSQTHLTATVPVSLPGSAGADGQLTLLGVGVPGRPWPSQFWIAGNLRCSEARLFQLSQLPRQVDYDDAEVADRVGIRDFAGRSFNGWHRHITLASAAHVITVVGRQQQC